MNGTNLIKIAVRALANNKLRGFLTMLGIIIGVAMRKSVKEFAEKHELDKFFLYGFGSHHFYLHQRYTSNPEMVMKDRVLSVHF